MLDNASLLAKKLLENSAAAQLSVNIKLIGEAAASMQFPPRSKQETHELLESHGNHLMGIL